MKTKDISNYLTGKGIDSVYFHKKSFELLRNFKTNKYSLLGLDISLCVKNESISKGLNQEQMKL